MFWNMERSVLRSRDILVLAKLLDEPPSWTFESLGRVLGLSKSAVHRSVVHLHSSRLLDLQKRRVFTSNAEEFLVHGLRYAFPATLGAETRGVPTAWAVAPLSTALARTTALPPIWPHPLGQVRGASVEPLDKVAPEAALRDENLHATLALLDALRVGDARVRSLAREMLEQRLATARPAA
jgi:hypothetical protein